MNDLLQKIKDKYYDNDLIKIQIYKAVKDNNITLKKSRGKTLKTYK
jgi:hypothetical protein